MGAFRKKGRGILARASRALNPIPVSSGRPQGDLPMRVWVVAILVLAPIARADVESDLRRAEARIAEQDFEGARLLIERALRAAPLSAPALALLAGVRGEPATELRLRALLEGDPLDPSLADPRPPAPGGGEPRASRGRPGGRMPRAVAPRRRGRGRGRAEGILADVADPSR